MLFLLAVVAVAIIAGGTATITGFGIGSPLAPLLALRLGTELAVAAGNRTACGGHCTAMRAPAARHQLAVLWKFGGSLLSGLFGGLVGNQGGIRSAALLGRFSAASSRPSRG